jgi:hypothetical protein
MSSDLILLPPSYFVWIRNANMKSWEKLDLPYPSSTIAESDTLLYKLGGYDVRVQVAGEDPNKHE